MISDELRGLVSRSEGFRAEAGTRRIRVHGDFHLGQALEVDGVVTIEDVQGHQSGDFVNVRITEAMDQDLAGVIIQGK